MTTLIRSLVIAGAIVASGSVAHARSPMKDSKAIRAAKASRVLGRAVTGKQATAVQQAHLIGKREIGKNGKAAVVGNYTQAQIGKKAFVLKKAGFSLKERRTLMKSGTVGFLEALGAIADGVQRYEAAQNFMKPDRDFGDRMADLHAMQGQHKTAAETRAMNNLIKGDFAGAARENLNALIQTNH